MLLLKLALPCFALATFCVPATSFVEPVECHGCELSVQPGTSYGAPDWSIVAEIGPPSGTSGDGSCSPYSGGCAAVACSVIGKITVDGPVGGAEFTFCRQTGSSSVYCLTPSQTTGADGHGSYTNAPIPHRCGCGSSYTYSTEVSDPETAVQFGYASATATCSPCEP